MTNNTCKRKSDPNEMGIYSSRYYARKAARGGEIVVKVEGGYHLMTADKWRVWRAQR